MRGHATEAVAASAVRARVCGACSQRPKGSEMWSAGVPRPCEDHCPIFLSLAGLIELSREPSATARPGACDRRIEDRVCAGCSCAPTAGDFCAERLARTCPLSRYGTVVVETLERVASHPHGVTTKAA